MSGAELIDRAQGIAARLRSGALPAATGERMAGETRRALAAEGLDRVGGDLANDLAVLTELSRGCPMTAWQVAQADGQAEEAVVRARLAAVMLGAAHAVLDEYEAFVRSRVSSDGPAPAADPETDYRRWLGMGIGHLETAHCILDEAARRPDDHIGLAMLAREVIRLAYDTGQDLIFHVAGSCPDRDRLIATVSAMLSLWGHPLGVGDDRLSRRVARQRLQLAADPA